MAPSFDEEILVVEAGGSVEVQSPPNFGTKESSPSGSGKWGFGAGGFFRRASPRRGRDPDEEVKSHRSNKSNLSHQQQFASNSVSASAKLDRSGSRLQSAALDKRKQKQKQRDHNDQRQRKDSDALDYVFHNVEDVVCDPRGTAGLPPKPYRPKRKAAPISDRLKLDLSTLTPEQHEQLTQHRARTARVRNMSSPSSNNSRQGSKGDDSGIVVENLQRDDDASELLVMTTAISPLESPESAEEKIQEHEDRRTLRLDNPPDISPLSSRTYGTASTTTSAPITLWQRFAARKQRNSNVDNDCISPKHCTGMEGLKIQEGDEEEDDEEAKQADIIQVTGNPYDLPSSPTERVDNRSLAPPRKFDDKPSPTVIVAPRRHRIPIDKHMKKAKRKKKTSEDKGDEEEQKSGYLQSITSSLTSITTDQRSQAPLLSTSSSFLFGVGSAATKQKKTTNISRVDVFQCGANQQDLGDIELGLTPEHDDDENNNKNKSNTEKDSAPLRSNASLMMDFRSQSLLDDIVSSYEGSASRGDDSSISDLVNNPQYYPELKTKSSSLDEDMVRAVIEAQERDEEEKKEDSSIFKVRKPILPPIATEEEEPEHSNNEVHHSSHFISKKDAIRQKKRELEAQFQQSANCEYVHHHLPQHQNVHSHKNKNDSDDQDDDDKAINAYNKKHDKKKTEKESKDYVQHRFGYDDHPSAEVYEVKTNLSEDGESDEEDYYEDSCLGRGCFCLHNDDDNKEERRCKTSSILIGTIIFLFTAAIILVLISFFWPTLMMGNSE